MGHICAVCCRDFENEKNRLVVCGNCDLFVHQGCYGVQKLPNFGKWFCRKCESQIRMSKIRCDLCPLRNGAFKRSNSDRCGWAHIVCALYINEARFLDNQTMDLILIDSLSQERFNKSCTFCERNQRNSMATYGACIQCAWRNCKSNFHASCAGLAGLLTPPLSSICDSQHTLASLIKGTPAEKMMFKCGGIQQPGISELLGFCSQNHYKKHTHLHFSTKEARYTVAKGSSIIKSVRSSQRLATSVSKTEPTSLHSCLPLSWRKRLGVSDRTILTSQKIESPLVTPVSSMNRDQFEEQYGSSNSGPISFGIASAETSIGPQLSSSISISATLHNGLADPISETSTPTTLSASEAYSPIDKEFKVEENAVCSTLPDYSVNPFQAYSSTASLPIISTPSLKISGTTPEAHSPRKHSCRNAALLANQEFTSGQKFSTQLTRGMESAFGSPNFPSESSNSTATRNKYGLKHLNRKKITYSNKRKVRLAARVSRARTKKCIARSERLFTQLKCFKPISKSIEIGCQTSPPEMTTPLPPEPRLPLVPPRRPLSLRGTVLSSSLHPTSLGGVSGSDTANPLSTMEDLLEWQWEQSSALLMQQAEPSDIASLLSHLHKLKSENDDLEKEYLRLEKKRNNIKSINTRLMTYLTRIETTNAYQPAFSDTDESFRYLTATNTMPTRRPISTISSDVRAENNLIKHGTTSVRSSLDGNSCLILSSSLAQKDRYTFFNASNEKQDFKESTTCRSTLAPFDHSLSINGGTGIQVTPVSRTNSTKGLSALQQALNSHVLATPNRNAAFEPNNFNLKKSTYRRKLSHKPPSEGLGCTANSQQDARAAISKPAHILPKPQSRDRSRCSALDGPGSLSKPPRVATDRRSFPLQPTSMSVISSSSGLNYASSPITNCGPLLSAQSITSAHLLPPLASFISKAPMEAQPANVIGPHSGAITSLHPNNNTFSPLLVSSLERVSQRKAPATQKDTKPNSSPTSVQHLIATLSPSAWNLAPVSSIESQTSASRIVSLTLLAPITASVTLAGSHLMNPSYSSSPKISPLPVNTSESSVQSQSHYSQSMHPQ